MSRRNATTDKDDLSRRTLLQTTATSISAGPLLPASTEITQAERFRPNARPEKLSENLFVLEDTCEDTCNVYVIRKSDHAVLIDFGSGDILDHLGDLGIARVDWILHTHHHRDQAQGDLRAVAERIPIAVPEHERDFFESVENFWRNRRIFELSDVKNDFFSLTQNVPVAAVLH
jgi:glyoxylase-like metal-dependent hydrolase (beta-lactamase superfamily II)